MGVLLTTGIDEDAAYILRARWYRFIDDARHSFCRFVEVDALAGRQNEARLFRCRRVRGRAADPAGCAGITTIGLGADARMLENRRPCAHAAQGQEACATSAAIESPAPTATCATCRRWRAGVSITSRAGPR